ncbi:MAG: LCP family protein [Anaerococcus sp.]|nr:LCP family protein [Anaerococcus sp.]
MKIKRFFIILLVGLLSYFGSNAILNKLQADELKKTYGDSYSFDDNAINVDENDHLILLVGVDKNGESDDQDFTRTDTIMLVRANTQTGKMDILSIPRDSRVKIREEFDKVNHAHAFGGIELTLQTLRNFLGLDIDYYVQVNYKAVENLITALGGVDFEVPKGVSIDVGAVKIREGLNHFNGQDVLWYLRTRKIYENGDIGRVNAQQGFMKAMVDQMVKKSDQLDLVTIGVNFLRYVKTNLPVPIMVDLAQNIDKFSSENVSTHTVVGEEATLGGTSYYLPDFEKTWDLVDEHFADFKLENWTKEKAGFNEKEEVKPVSQPEEVIEEESYYEEYYYEPVYDGTYDDSYYYEDSYYYKDDYYYEEDSDDQEPVEEEVIEEEPLEEEPSEPVEETEESVESEESPDTSEDEEDE